MDRLIIAKLYVDGKNMPEDKFNYSDNIRAVCTLNNIIVGFIVYRSKIFFKEYFILKIDLPSLKRNGRPFGIAKFNTLDEAIETGKNIITNFFPSIDIEDISNPDNKDVNDE